MAKKSFESTLAAGTRAELLSTWRIVQAGRSNDAGIVIGLYAAATLISLVVSAFSYSSGGALVLDVVLYAAWAGLAYVFIAIGTKLAHNMATWGIALVGSILAILKVIGAIVGAATVNTANEIFDGTDLEVPGTGTYIFRMFVYAIIAAVCLYAVIKMHRAMQSLAHTPAVHPEQ